MMTLFDDQDVKSTGEDSVQTMLGGNRGYYGKLLDVRKRI